MKKRKKKEDLGKYADGTPRKRHQYYSDAGGICVECGQRDSFFLHTNWKLKAEAVVAAVLKPASASTGLRYNTGKPRMSLTSPWALEGLSEVLTYGEKKYAAWNWAKGLSWSQTIDSLERHLAAFKKGEDLDPESGLPHLDHIQCNAMFLSHFQKTKTGTDDRWKRS